MGGREIEFPKAELLRRLALSDSGFVFDPVSGDSFTVNDTGLAILRQLQQGADLAGLLAALTAEFVVTAETAERDAIEFAGVLRSRFK